MLEVGRLERDESRLVHADPSPNGYLVKGVKLMRPGLSHSLSQEDVPSLDLPMAEKALASSKGGEPIPNPPGYLSFSKYWPGFFPAICIKHCDLIITGCKACIRTPNDIAYHQVSILSSQF